MPQSRLVTATYSTAAAASITMGKSPFCRYQPLRLVLIIDLTWTDVVWNRMFAILSRNLDIQDELIDMDHLYTDFRLLDNDTEIKRGIFFQKDIKAIAAPAIRLMEALTEFGPRVRHAPRARYKQPFSRIFTDSTIPSYLTLPLG